VLASALLARTILGYLAIRHKSRLIAVDPLGDESLEKHGSSVMPVA
jgi:hypothetical protein